MASTDRTRPAGLAPGSGAFVASWIVTGLVARLTGTPAVLALMAALLVTIAAEALAGWLLIRRCAVTSIVAPRVTTVGVATPLTIETTVGPVRRDGRLTISSNGATVCVLVLPDPARIGDRGLVADAIFETAGIIESLVAKVEFTGPFGLVWWRHTTTVAVTDIAVAPTPGDGVLHVDRASALNDGLADSSRGNQRGDVDGVRTWRDGDAVGAIHWPSSLRAGDLIVHDRAATTDERWMLDLDEVIASTNDAAATVAGRVRATLERGLRDGYQVAISHDGDEDRVRSDDDAARWSAWVAQTVAHRHGDTSPAPVDRPWWRREIRVGRARLFAEPASSVRAPARWAAGAAAVASLSMLVGALSPSYALVAVIAVGVGLGVFVSLWVARRGRRPVALQVAIVLAVIAALAVIASDARSVDGLLAALRGPMPNLLVLLVVLHGFEVTDRRTLRVHQAITFVVAAYAAGLRIDTALGWWIAAWGAAFFASLLLTARTPGEAGDAGDAEAGLAHRVHRVHRVPVHRGHRGLLLRPAAWVGLGVAATVALLSVVPIPDGPARLGLPALSTSTTGAPRPGGLSTPDGSLTALPSTDTAPDRRSIGNAVGYPGFTDRLDTSVRGDLGDAIVMRVRAPESAFWRGQTFTRFDGRTWTVSPERGRRQSGPIIDVTPTVGDASGADLPAEELTQTYYVEADLPNVVFAAARPKQVIFDGALWTRPDGALRSDVTLTAGSVYTVISERPAVTADMLRAQGDLAPFFSGFRQATGGDAVDRFLELPASTTRRTIDLADSLRTPGESTYDTILSYEQWLGENTQYDLDAPVPAAGADAVDDFLFESQRGFCEQIASTMAIMLRTQGVPARLATGYVAGERDRVSGVWKVRASDAHAWVEVWFPLTGWQAFDPTASVPFAGDAGGGTVGGDLVGASVSSIVSHRLQVGALGLALVVGWLLLSALSTWRHRRRRGRWGLLQDRFSTLSVNFVSTRAGDCGPDAERPVLTNPDRAALVGPSGVAMSVAMSVATTLDRAAFDPDWVDDDEAYRATRSAVTVLERTSKR